MNLDACPQFFTATILEWKSLLQNDAYKNVITTSLQFLVEANRVTIYAFVIMPNHIHLIWQMKEGQTQQKVQHSFLKYTAQQFKFELVNSNSNLLQYYLANAADRQYQFWERNPLSIPLYTQDVFLQKLEYIHNNPVQDKWKLSEYPELYRWSSAKFYNESDNEFSFLRHYVDGEL